MANIPQRSIIRNDELVDMLMLFITKYGGVKISGFGTFNIQKMPARKRAFNPFTKKYHTSKSYNKIKFTPSIILKNKIQK